MSLHEAPKILVPNSTFLTIVIVEKILDGLMAVHLLVARKPPPSGVGGCYGAFAAKEMLRMIFPFHGTDRLIGVFPNIVFFCSLFWLWKFLPNSAPSG